MLGLAKRSTQPTSVPGRSRRTAAAKRRILEQWRRRIVIRRHGQEGRMQRFFAMTPSSGEGTSRRGFLRSGAALAAGGAAAQLVPETARGQGADVAGADAELARL